MLFTPGDILTAAAVLLSSLATLIAWKSHRAVRAQLLSLRDLAAMSGELAPPKWESRLRDLGAEVVSLSSSYEKIEKQLMRLNSRAGMREMRARESVSQGPPPREASKAEKLRYYGMAGKMGPEFARAQQELEVTRSTN